MPSDRTLRARTEMEMLLASQLQKDRERIKASRKEGRPQEIIRPPSVRELRGETEWPQEQIADEEGNPSSPFRAIDILRKLHLRGTISLEEKQAGHQFQDDFDRAGLEQLRAADMGRVPSGKSSGGPTAGQIEAREAVWIAICALGGLTSAAGGCVWHVLGHRDTLEQWTTRESFAFRAINRHIARGILIGALGALRAHYADSKKDLTPRNAR